MKKLAIFFVSLFLLVGVVAAAAPVIDSINDQTVTEGASYSLQVNATDADNDSLTYSLITSPAGMNIDSNGLITWSATGASTSVTVQVEDTNSETDTETFQISIIPTQPSIALGVSSVKIGDDNTVRGTTFNEIIVVTNTGSETLTNIVGSIQTLSGGTLDSDFNANVQVSSSSLAPGASANVVLTITVPNDKNSRTQTIGRILVTADGDSLSVNDDLTVSMEAESFLEITDVEIEIDGDDEGVSEGETIDDPKEGDEIKVTVTIENLYDENDREIEDVEVTIEADENDWDIDEDSNQEDLDDGDDEDFTFEFTLDDDIDDDTTDVTISVVGDDKNDNFEHYDEFTFTLEIDREDDEVTITNVEFGRSSYSCTDSFADLEVTIKNTGTDDQDEVTLQVVAEDLDWNRRIREIELDDGDRETYDFRIPLADADETNDYFVDIEAFVDDDDRTDSEIVTFAVTCNEESSSSNSGSNNGNSGSQSSGNSNDRFDDEETVVIVTPPTTNTGNTGSSANTGASGTIVYGEPVGAFDNVRGSNLYVVLLIALLVLVLIGIFLLGGRLLNN